MVLIVPLIVFYWYVLVSCLNALSYGVLCVVLELFVPSLLSFADWLFSFLVVRLALCDIHLAWVLIHTWIMSGCHASDVHLFTLL